MLMLSGGPSEDGSVNQPKTPRAHGTSAAYIPIRLQQCGLKGGEIYIVCTNRSSGGRHNFNQCAFIFSGRIHSEQEIKEMPRAFSEQ